MMDTTRVLVPLAEGVEEMEAVILIDTFRRAGWRVDVVGLTAGPVVASRGVRLVPDMEWDEIDPSGYEVIALPGGNLGTVNLMEDARVLDAVRAQHGAGRLVAAVCAAPLVLQRAGILRGHRVTCHPLAAGQLHDVPRDEARVVVSDHVVTSQGPGTTMAFALTLIALREGREKAEEVARGMVTGLDWGE
jgi:4-methyl-5(b-hydroxyethyl)-thiazole monophosphate biosynthesis